MPFIRVIVHQASTVHSGLNSGELQQQIQQQVQQSVQEAAQAARDASQAARDARARAREAQHTVVTIDGRPVIAGALPGEGVAIYPPQNPNEIPQQAVDIAIGFFVMCAVMVVGWPIARAFGRRIEKRAEVSAPDPMLTGQLQRIEQAVEAMAIEVERISESQRFMARLQNGAGEPMALPADRR